MTYEIPRTREEFERLVLTVKATERLPFVRAVYRVMDELSTQARLSQDPPFACASGCSFCCHQLVFCTKMEWRVIYEFLLGQGLLRRIGARLREGVKAWRQYYETHNIQRVQSNELVVADFLGKRCVYLNDAGVCDIYPVRPVDCRTMYSKTRCQDWHWPEVARFPFPWDMWANNMILEEDEKSSGRNMMGVTPLPHWLCTIQI